MRTELTRIELQIQIKRVTWCGATGLHEGQSPIGIPACSELSQTWGLIWYSSSHPVFKTPLNLLNDSWGVHPFCCGGGNQSLLHAPVPLSWSLSPFWAAVTTRILSALSLATWHQGWLSWKKLCPCSSKDLITQTPIWLLLFILRIALIFLALAWDVCWKRNRLKL